MKKKTTTIQLPTLMCVPDKVQQLTPLLATECSFEKWNVKDAQTTAAVKQMQFKNKKTLIDVKATSITILS